MPAPAPPEAPQDHREIRRIDLLALGNRRVPHHHLDDALVLFRIVSAAIALDGLLPQTCLHLRDKRVDCPVEAIDLDLCRSAYRLIVLSVSRLSTSPSPFRTAPQMPDADCASGDTPILGGGARPTHSMTSGRDASSG